MCSNSYRCSCVNDEPSPLPPQNRSQDLLVVFASSHTWAAQGLAGADDGILKSVKELRFLIRNRTVLGTIVGRTVARSSPVTVRPATVQTIEQQ